MIQALVEFSHTDTFFWACWFWGGFLALSAFAFVIDPKLFGVYPKAKR